MFEHKEEWRKDHAFVGPQNSHNQNEYSTNVVCLHARQTMQPLTCFRQIHAVNLVLSLCVAIVAGNVAASGNAAELGPTAPIFEDIYDSRAWASESDQSASGPGSEIYSAAVNETLAFVLEVVEAHISIGGGIVLADAGCGDLLWVGLLVGELAAKRKGRAVEYEGYDIVDIAARGGLKRLHQGLEQGAATPPYPRFRVTQLDVTRQALSTEPNLVLFKDVINHLQLAPARAALCLLAQAAAPPGGLLVVTNNRNSRKNTEIDADVVGYESRPRNLLLPPFSFPKPLASTDYLAVWKAADLVNGPCSSGAPGGTVRGGSEL